MYLFGVLGLSALFYVKFSGSIRHHGLIFIFFLFVLWISKYYSDELFSKDSFDRLRSFWHPISPLRAKKIVVGILVIHVIGGIMASVTELRYDFSGGKRVAHYLERNNLATNDTLLIGHPAYATQSIIPYFSSRKTLYFPDVQKEQSFIVYNKALAIADEMSSQEFMNIILNKVHRDHPQKTILILDTVRSRQFKSYTVLNSYFQEMTCLPKNEITIVGDESFCIYSLKHIPIDSKM